MDTGSAMRPERSDLLVMAVLLVSAVVIWLPALWTPFWGDDYVFLQAARAANLAGQPWTETFWPLQPELFWRPLSQTAWWRVVEGVLQGDVLVAHSILLVLQLMAALGVGVLGLAVARVAGWPSPWAVAGLSAGFYGVLAVSLLTVHWVAAANSPLLVLSSTLLLASWLAASRAAAGRCLLLLALVPCLLTVALLTKESAILMPVLMLLLSRFSGARLRRGEWGVLAVSVAVAVVWLMLRSKATLPPAPQYAYVFGGNLVKNGASFGAWLLNVPREALRMIATGELLRGAGWALLAALPMLLSWALAASKGGWARINHRQWGLLAVFAVVTYAPYFPLVWNSYEYYAAISAILPAIVLARLLQGRRIALVAAGLMALSCWVSVAGTRWLDHPGLIGRARWAETSLQQLAGQQLKAPLWVIVADEQRFYAVGAHGLAWRLELPLEQVHVVETCPTRGSGTCLQMDAEGRWSHHRLSP